MKLKRCLAHGALMILPFAAMAQGAQPPDPADATAPVPASAYASAFENYRATADEQASPDQAWRTANAEMGRLGGHAGHLKGNTAALPIPAPGPEQARIAPRMRPMNHGEHHH